MKFIHENITNRHTPLNPYKKENIRHCGSQNGKCPPKLRLSECTIPVVVLKVIELLGGGASLEEVHLGGRGSHESLSPTSSVLPTVRLWKSDLSAFCSGYLLSCLPRHYGVPLWNCKPKYTVSSVSCFQNGVLSQQQKANKDRHTE